jgi:tubby-related protein 1
VRGNSRKKNDSDSDDSYEYRRGSNRGSNNHSRNNSSYRNDHTNNDDRYSRDSRDRTENSKGEERNISAEGVQTSSSGDKGFVPKSLRNVTTSNNSHNNKSQAAWRDTPQNVWNEKENNHYSTQPKAKSEAWNSAKPSTSNNQYSTTSPKKDISYSDEEEDYGSDENRNNKSSNDFYIEKTSKTNDNQKSFNYNSKNSTQSNSKSAMQDTKSYNSNSNVSEVEIVKEDNQITRKTGRYDSECNNSTHSTLMEEDMEENNLGDGNDIIKESASAERKQKTISNRMTSSVPFVLQAHESGGLTDLVQCVIIRDRDSVQSKLYPTYRLYLEDKNKLILLARKMTYNRTSNYHMFDMTRGTAGSKLSKKSGNYLGKLRAMDANKTEYTVVTKCESCREEVGAIMFDRYGLMNQLKEGCQPRKMTVLLPQLSPDSEPIPHKVVETKGKSAGKSMIDMLRDGETTRMFLLASKDPVFENGNYRLNFHGRVSVPSVKNFQLSSPDDPGHVICQFGKVGEDRFHLDFKAPLNAFQAFSLALCHFNI